MTGAANPRSTAVVALAAIAAVGVGYLVSDVVNPLLAAFLIAYTLDPLVDRLTRRWFPRAAAVVLVFVVFFAALCPLAWFGTRAAVRGGADLAEAIQTTYYPAIHEAAEARLADLSARLADDDRARGAVDRLRAALRAPGAEAAAVRAVDDLGMDASALARDLMRCGARLLSFLILVPIFTFFILLRFDDIIAWIRDHLPGRHRQRIVSVVSRIDLAMAAFFRGRLIMAVAKALLTWAGLAACGVRFSFPIGMAAGGLSLVPLVGPTLAAVAGGTMILLDHPADWGGRLTALMAIVLAIEAVEGLLFMPLVLGREVGLHPVALILAVMAGGEVFGLYGVLLAVPLASVAKILLAEFVMPYVKALAAENEDG